MNGLFMINDPGVGGHSVQVVSRYFTGSGGSTYSNARYIDILSNGDAVPSSIISTTMSALRTGQTFEIDINPYRQRLVAWQIVGFGSVAAQSARSYYSDNLGITWTQGGSPAGMRQYRKGMYIEKWDRWIALGLTQTASPFSTVACNSTDGVTFSQTQTITGNVYASVTKMDYSPSLDLAVFANGGTATKNCCYWTSDGLTWYAGTFSGTSFNPGEGGVLWQDYHSSFIVSRNGTNNTNRFATSTDGKNWNPVTTTGLLNTPSGYGIQALAHNPFTGRTVIGKFSGAAAANVIAYSDDGGTTWTEVNLSSNQWWLEFGEYNINTDMFILTTRYSSSGQQGILMSSNGVNWTYYPQTNLGVIFSAQVPIP
jgi:hypothetical protein